MLRHYEGTNRWEVEYINRTTTRTIRTFEGPDAEKLAREFHESVNCRTLKPEREVQLAVGQYEKIILFTPHHL